MLADPRRVVLTERRAGDDAEPLGAETRHREVALDPAARVEHLRVRHAARLAGDTVGAEALEEVGGARTDDVELRERRLVEECRRLAARPVLCADRRATTASPPSRAAGATRSPASAFGSNQFARSQPDFSPKAAPSSRRRRVGRRDPQRATGLAFVAGVLHVVVRLVDLLRPGERVPARAVRGSEADASPCARRRATACPRRSTRQRASPCRPRRRARAHRTRRRPRSPAHVARAEDELAVGRERLRPVDELHDAHLLERRNADDRRSASAPRTVASPPRAASR